MNINEFFPYSWFVDDSETEITSIRVYGIGTNNENICLRITDFTPYIYLELPSHIPWNDMKAQMIGNKLDEMMGKQKPLKKCLIYKYKLYGANLNEDGTRKKYPFLFCSFSTRNDIRKLSYDIQKKNLIVPGLGAIKLKMHEQDADPILQLTVAKDLPTAGWIKFSGQLVKSEDDKITLCDLEYKVKWKNMTRIEKQTVGLPKIMGFDIEVNSSNPSSMPKVEKPEDKIFQVSCVFAREGSKIYTPYLLTLGNPIQELVGENVKILRFMTEADLLIGFTELIRTENPNVIVGYNILSFDIPYMIDRSKRPCRVNHIFDTLGFHKYNHAKEKIIKWSSSAYKNQEFKFLDGEGRLFVDLLPLVKRDFKMDNYRLKTVSDYFLGQTKDDLSVKGIFKCYRIGTKKELDGTYSYKARKAMSVVGKYCIVDSELTVKLMDKLQIFIGLTEMSNVCCVQPFALYTQGQQIKVYSQVYKYCYTKNILVEKDGYICKDDERYTGAHVFPPVPGLYSKVVPFDFASLYPSTMIAYNIDYSTYVTDDSIPDSKCHVMSWSEHHACIVQGTNITLNGFGVDIQNLENNNNLILSHSEKSNLLEYKRQSNFFNKGQKDCIEITFQDGTTLKCTPDHKIMTSDNVWIEAKDLKINETKIKKGITFPLTNFKEFICDFELNCKNINLNMNNIHEIEKFCKFSRLFGMLYTDGSLQKNRASIYTGDVVDAECVINDIYDVCGVKNNYKLIEKDNSKYYHITVPYEFHNSYIWKLGDGYGKRITRDSKLPSFILDKNCPIILKREFIGGMFGGDGLSITYCDKTENYTTIGFCISKIFEKIDNVTEFLNSIQNILLNDFNIGTYINGPYKKKDNNIYTLNLHINVNDIIKFRDMIGFRYCTYKSFKLDVFCSYKNLINNVFDEREKSFKIIKKLHETLTWDKSVEEGHKIIRKNEIIFNNHYAFPPKYAVIDSIRRPRDGNKKTFWSSKFPSFEKYLKELNVYDSFVDDKHNKSSSTYCMKQTVLNDIPYYELKVILIKPIGKHNVYDIEVNDNHSFLADGIVVHNCIHDPKIIRKNELTVYIDEEKKKITKLREKRDDKKNKLIKQKIIDELNQKVEELKPYIQERSKIVKTISKHIMCASRYYRFLKEPKGVIPTILQNLLDARKNTRKLIKINKDIIKNSTDENEKANLIMLNNILDKRQLSYKVSCNSQYGAMGVKRGYLPFMIGAMCLSGDSLISFSYGFTRKMKDLTNTDYLWTYNENGQVVSNGKGLIYNGKKELIKITLIDGRILRCTPDHKIMTTNGWVEAGKLVSKHKWDGGEYSKVITGLELPEDIIGEDEKNWKLLDYTMDTPDNRDKTLAFCRILGFIFSDNKLFSKVIIETLFDSEIFSQDIKLLTGYQPIIHKSNNTFIIHIPKILVDKIISLIDQPYTLPIFLSENNCPLSVTREFLGGLFGRNCSLSQFSLRLITLEKHKDNMENTMNKLIYLLSRFGINFVLSKLKFLRIDEIPYSEYTITTENYYLLLFANKIGFRYCIDKNNKLTISSSYQRYLNNEFNKNKLNFLEYTKLVGSENLLHKCSCLYLDVIDIRYDGVDDVYDIIDVPNHSFLANGIIVHNCTTYMGRVNIEVVAKTIPEKYGGELVYGDQLVSVI